MAGLAWSSTALVKKQAWQHFHLIQGCRMAWEDGWWLRILFLHFWSQAEGLRCPEIHRPSQPWLVWSSILVLLRVLHSHPLFSPQGPSEESANRSIISQKMLIMNRMQLSISCVSSGILMGQEVGDSVRKGCLTHMWGNHTVGPMGGESNWGVPKFCFETGTLNSFLSTAFILKQ